MWRAFSRCRRSASRGRRTRSRCPPTSSRPTPGVYRVDAGTTRTLTLENGRLYSQRSGGPRAAITPVAKDTFGIRNSFTRMTFERDAAGKVAAMIVDDGRTKTRAARTDEKPATRTEITIEPAKLDRYTGR